jgi:hypothetical protein
VFSFAPRRIEIERVPAVQRVPIESENVSEVGIECIGNIGGRDAESDLWIKFNTWEWCSVPSLELDVKLSEWEIGATAK